MSIQGALELPVADAFAQLLASASERNLRSFPYCGDVLASEAFEFCKNNPALIIDVRTPQEWQKIGVPDLANTASQLLAISWLTLPNFALNQNFAKELSTAKNITKTTPLFFLCKSGGRSLDAAIFAKNLGYEYTFNIAGGFEGGEVAGWKEQALPHKQYVAEEYEVSHD
jgi:rhodanese-related sulfurtransferase